MEVCINAFHVGKRDSFSQYHFIEGTDEERIEESPVKDRKTNHPTYEFEIIEMFGVDARMRIYLKCIIVVRRVLEETIEWIKHLM